MREVMNFVCPWCGLITDGVHEGEKNAFYAKYQWLKQSIQVMNTFIET